MDSVCGDCAKPITPDQKSLKCNGCCDHVYHLECSSVAPADFENFSNEKKSSWQCSKCINQKCSVCTKIIGQSDSRIRCTGLCSRNFHLHCSGYKKLLGAADEKWQCVTCFDGPKCRVCDKPFKRRDKKILCTGVCQKYYHLSCLDIPVDAFEEQWSGKEDSWVCFPCQENPKKSDSIDSGKLDEKGKLKRDNKMLRNELKSINEVLVCLSSELVEQRRLVKEAESEVLNLSEAILVKQEELVELYELLKSVGIKMDDRMKKNQIPIMKNNLNSQSNKRNDISQEKKITFPENNSNSIPTQTPKRYRQNYHSYKGMKNTHCNDISNEVCLKMPSDTVVLHVESTSDSHARLKVRNSRAEPQVNYCSHSMVRLKDIATQTDDDPPNPYLLEPDVIRDYRTMMSGMSLPTSPEYSDRSRSPMKSPRGRGNIDLHKSAYCFPGIAPTTPVFDKPNAGEAGKSSSEMYIRQYQYREELKKQIEERHRLEAERKEKERLEEEAIEKRVREQQEKLRRQYEIEEQERLDYIMRRHIQDDVLRQRLADIQQHDSQTLRDKPDRPQQRMRPMTVTHDVSRTRPMESSGVEVADTVEENTGETSGVQPGDPASVSELVESAEEILKAPLLEKNQVLSDSPAKSRTGHARVPPPTACSWPHPPEPCSIRDSSSTCRLQAERLLREPLLSVERCSPDAELPVLKAVSPCVNVPRTKSRTNNAEILDNKWQIPAVEKSYIQPRAPHDGAENNSYHSSDSVLTQLGSFRRQLQMEHLRMIERMHQQSKHRPS